MPEMQLPAGFSAGATPAERPGRWFDGNLIRFQDGVLKAVGGWQRLTPTPLPSPVRRIIAVRDNTDISRIVTGHDDRLLIFDGGVWFDATPAGFTAAGINGIPDGFGTGAYSTDQEYSGPSDQGDPALLRASTWSLDSWGEMVLGLASSDGRLMAWNPQTPTTKAAVVANAPTGVRAMCVMSEQRFCILVGGTLQQSRRVRWSAREDYTTWNPTPTNNAGFYDLDSDGLLMGVAEVREGVLCFSDSDVWLLNFIGGEFVFGKQRVGTTSLLSPHAVATFGGRAVWMGKDSFWIYEAGQVRPLPCEVAHRVFNDLDAINSVLFSHASDNARFPEVTWWYCSEGSAVPNRYVTWNYQNNIWTTGEMPRTAACPAGVSRFPLAVGADGHLYEHENGSTAAGISRVGSVWVETGTVATGGQVRIQRMQCDSSVPNQTRVTVIARDTRDGGDITFGPFTPMPDGRTPVRAGGQDLRVKLEALTDDPAWSVGRFIVDAAPIGAR